MKRLNTYEYLYINDLDTKLTNKEDIKEALEKNKIKFFNTTDDFLKWHYDNKTKEELIEKLLDPFKAWNEATKELLHFEDLDLYGFQEVDNE